MASDSKPFIKAAKPSPKDFRKEILQVVHDALLDPKDLPPGSSDLIRYKAKRAKEAADRLMLILDAIPVPANEEPVAAVTAFVKVMRGYTDRIQNGRSLDDIHDHMEGEMKELALEFDAIRAGSAPGPDGISGESIDVALCGVDLALKADPGSTDEEIARKILAKADKWETEYAHIVRRR